MASRDSSETVVQNRNGNSDNAEKGKKSKDENRRPEEVGLLNKNLRPVLFDVVKNIVFTSMYQDLHTVRSNANVS